MFRVIEIEIDRTKFKTVSSHETFYDAAKVRDQLNCTEIQKRERQETDKFLEYMIIDG